MTLRYAVICARGGSKRVPEKNLLHLNGNPLLDYTISEAQKSYIFDKIIVNSEDDRILEVARSCGSDLYKRPDEYKSGKIFVIDVIREMMRSLCWENDDEIAVLFPTVPLRTANDLKQSYQIFVENGRTYPVVSVCKYEYPIQTALFVDEEGYLEPVFKEDYKKSTRHDDQQETYRANYAVVWNTVQNMFKQEKLIGVNAIPYYMPLDRSVDIDENYQVKVAELLLKDRDGK